MKKLYTLSTTVEEGYLTVTIGRFLKIFYNWANISGYSEGLTIDRIDVNGNYEPKNCRWISHKEQGVNKRKTIRYEYLGETLTCNEFAEKYNINKNTLYARLSRGCDIREAIEYKR